ncbi:cytochrome P450 302a1, mitochondrial [Lucilia cuprina]|uniref:cytochrome P450 302a1, mitochondrial n=1 Tax=Lucilia cuprina TaxID=7375 RepID=UPI001F0519BA|nr:cytochrome P450 302a1, mitochondrial [Lucilia cuprina]
MRHFHKFHLSKTRTYSTKPQFAKPYQDIPGPRGPLGLGNIYKYLPLVGQYSWQALHKAGADKYEKYGPIVKETMVPGEDIVWLYDPKDVATLLNEKDCPLRRSHLALEKYRKDRPHVYRTAGLLPTNGTEWWRLRSELQKEISAPKSVRSFLLEVDEVTKEFIDYVPKNENIDILPKLTRLNLELTCLITFGERLNSFTELEQLSNSRSSKLMLAAETTNSNILPTDQGLRLWRYFETAAYKKLRKSQEFMESVAVDLVSQKLAYFKDTSIDATESPTSLSRTCLIEEYLKNPNLDLCDVVGTAADLLLAGIDTTSYSTAFALYHISRHPMVQQRIYEESLKAMKEPDAPILADSLNTGIPYTRAVLKEVFRLNPISVGVGRILNRDLILGGYHVPKETVVVTQNMVACRLEKNFKNALAFQPERWLNNARSSINPYLVLPFGHGMRACIARRLAEQNILVLLLRFIRNYEISWQGIDDELDVVTLLINKPSEPVAIKLKQRM